MYLTLVSDVTSDYASNVANKFKVKTGLRLHGEGWKVSIVSAMLPKMALFKDLQDVNADLIVVYGKSEKRGQTDQFTKGNVEASYLRTWETADIGSTAQDFFHAVKQRLEETGYTNLDAGFTFSSKQSPRLAWDKNGSQPEMVIANTNEASNLCYINKSLASALGWAHQKPNGDVIIGKNMVHGYADNTKGTTSLTNGKVIVKDNNFFKLSTLSDWRFINLNQSFKEALNLHARPLTVTAKVTAGSNTIPQALGHVYYAPQGRQRFLFTPPIEEFYPVQTNEWDEVEISLKELDESLVKFQSDSQCVLRLHFKKD